VMPGRGMGSDRRIPAASPSSVFSSTAAAATATVQRLSASAMLLVKRIREMMLPSLSEVNRGCNEEHQRKAHA
jgi:hypothetical protein